MTSVMQYEKLVNEVLIILLRQLSNRFADKPGSAGIVDFPTWLHYFTDDAITKIIYGASIGHLEAAKDNHGTLAAMNQILTGHIYFAQWPIVDWIVRKNPIRLWLGKHGYFNGPGSVTVQHALREQGKRKDLRRDVEKAGDQRIDNTLTDKFLSAQEKAESTGERLFGPKDLLALGLSVIAAGSETTAISLSAFFYFLLKHPSCYAKLRAEVDEALPRSEKEPQPILSFSASQTMPYLSACLKETFRLHPAPAWYPERVVTSPAGHMICGKKIPKGTIVGVSAWLVHRNRDIFGSDADTYRPERWLEATGEKAKEMDRNLIQFGHGAYTCIGKNIALMELGKCVPTLMRSFDIELADPEKEWTFIMGSFVNVTDIDVRLKTRSY